MDQPDPPPAPDPRHTGQLLRDASDDYTRRMNDRRMFLSVPATVSGAQNLVLQYLDPDGTPVAEILERSGLPRAAFDAIVTQTQLSGDYLEVRDEVLYYTDIGRSTFASMRRAQEAIEEAYLKRLGPVRYAVLREALADLAPRPDFRPSRL